MKLVHSLIAASLLAGVAPGVVFADCNPPCKGNRVCRYDSTHNPPFFCRKPAAPQSAPNSSPATPGAANQAAAVPSQSDTAKRVGPRKPDAQYNPKEVGVDRRK